MTKNPRPRKYASAAERQAAYRNRWATLEFRTTPEQAATLQSIADEAYEGNRADLIHALIQFALTNHNWRMPTFTARTPTLADFRKSGDFYIRSRFDRSRNLWVSELRAEVNGKLELAAKERTDAKRPAGLTWEDFEAFGE